MMSSVQVLEIEHVGIQRLEIFYMCALRLYSIHW